MFSTLFTQLLQQYPVLAWAVPLSTAVVGVGVAVVVQKRRQKALVAQSSKDAVSQQETITSTNRGGIDFAAIAEESTVKSKGKGAESTPTKKKSRDISVHTASEGTSKPAEKDVTTKPTSEPMPVKDSAPKEVKKVVTKAIVEDEPRIGEVASVPKAKERNVAPAETPTPVKEAPASKESQKKSTPTKTKAPQIATQKSTNPSKKDATVKTQPIKLAEKIKEKGPAMKQTKASAPRITTKEKDEERKSTKQQAISLASSSSKTEISLEDKMFGSAQAVSTTKFASLYNPLDEKRPGSVSFVDKKQPSKSTFGSDISNVQKSQGVSVVDGYAMMGAGSWAASKPVWRQSSNSSKIQLNVRPTQSAPSLPSKAEIPPKQPPTEKIQSETKQTNLPKAKRETKATQPNKQQKDKSKQNQKQQKGKAKQKQKKEVVKVGKADSTETPDPRTPNIPFGAVIPTAIGKFVIFQDPSSFVAKYEPKSTPSQSAKSSIFGSDILKATTSKLPQSIAVNEGHDVSWVAENQPWNAPTKAAESKPVPKPKKEKKQGKATKPKKQVSKSTANSMKQASKPQSPPVKQVSKQTHPTTQQDAPQPSTTDTVENHPSKHGSTNAVASQRFSILHDPTLSVSRVPPPPAAKMRPVFGSNINVATKPCQSWESWSTALGNKSTTSSKGSTKPSTLPRASAKYVQSGAFTVFHDPSVPVPEIPAKREKTTTSICFGSNILGEKEDLPASKPKQKKVSDSKKKNTKTVSPSKPMSGVLKASSSAPKGKENVKKKTNAQTPQQKSPKASDTSYGAVRITGSSKFAIFDDPNASSVPPKKDTASKSPAFSNKTRAKKSVPFGSTLPSVTGQPSMAPQVAGLWAAEQQLWLSQ